MKVSVSGVDDILRKLKDIKPTPIDISKIADRIVADLVAATPVDTGRARQGWKYSLTPKGFKISNDVPYIEALNQGHSQQAPSYFVERVLISHGKPLGTIVDRTPN